MPKCTIIYILEFFGLKNPGRNPEKLLSCWAAAGVNGGGFEDVEEENPDIEMDEPEYEPNDQGGYRRVWNANIFMMQ